MQCNIDARGKAVRLISGVAVLMLGITLMILLLFSALAGPFGGIWGWALCFTLLFAGGFAIYEGWAGWCVVRAMGIKTPI